MHVLNVIQVQIINHSFQNSHLLVISPRLFIYNQRFIQHMKSYLLIIALALLSLLSTQQDTKKLIFVQQVFRHGARYPISYSSKDYSNLTNINVLKGQLTNQGRSQHYLLGQRLYQTYWERLFGKNNNKYKQEKFYFKSTDVNRTIQSLQSHLIGVFENTDIYRIDDSEIPFSLPAWNDTFDRKAGNLFDKSPYFHPLPIHVQKGFSTPWTHGDILRTYDPLFCPKQHGWQQANKRDPFILNITQNSNFTKALAALGQVLQQNVTFFDILKYYDNAICLTYLGKQPLPIFTQKNGVAQDLAKMFDLNDSNSRLQLLHYLFNQTVNHFKRVTANQDGVQWAFYSAHDTTVENILARLDLTSVKCIYQNYLNGTKNSEYCVLEFPAFTSQVIFQVYMYPNKTYTFQILYNGNYKRIPFCGYQYECKVEQFYSWYDSWKDQDWVKTCGVTNETAETYFSIIIIELGLIIVFAVSAILRYLNNKKKEVDERKQAEGSGVNGQIRQTLLTQQNQNV